MHTLRRFLHLSIQDQLLLFQTVFTMSAVRASLGLFPVRSVHRLALKVTWVCGDPLSSDRIVWAVRTATRTVPGSTCLVQAIAAQALLVRHGYKPLLTIGVTKNEVNRFGAHAWVVCENEVLLRDREVAKYTPLLNLES